MKNKITKNWGLKLVSFLFAAVLWIVVTNINDPVDSFRATDVPVTIKNTELITDRGQIYEVLDGTGVIDTVVVYAPRSVIATLDKNNIVAVADMQDLTSLDTIPIKLSINKYNDKLESIKGNIDSVKLNIENKVTRSFPIRASVTGEVKEGYMLGTVTTEQNLVRISGPESVITQIAKAQAEVDVAGFSGNIGTDTDIRLYDAENKEIKSSGLEKSISKVRVFIEIFLQKTVPINYTVSGTPAEGYRLTGETESTRSSVMIAGRSSALQQIDAIEIPEDVLDVTGATDDVTTLVDLNDYLPEGIILAEEDFGGKINITAHVGQEMRRTFAKRLSDIRIVGVPAGFKAEFEEPGDNCLITLVGLSDGLQEINTTTLEVSVDVGAWLLDQGMETPESGSYTIPVSVGIPEGSTVTWEKAEVQVNITEAQ